jgi:hypothetical protein
MEKEHLIFGIRAIVEAITAGKEVDKVFLQKTNRLRDQKLIRKQKIAEY